MTTITDKNDTVRYSITMNTMDKLIVLSLIVIFSYGCSTYSALRPADNLKAGQIELTAGAAANEFGDANLAARATVGVTDWLELGAQYESEAWLANARLGILSTKKHGIALSTGVEVGQILLLRDIENLFTDIKTDAIGANIVVGRRFGPVEPYLSAKVLYTPEEILLSVGKIGLRTYLKRFFMGIEGGASFYNDDFAVGEGTLYGGLQF